MHHLRSRPMIHSNHEGAVPDLEHPTEHQYGISPTDGWPVRMSQPMAGTVPSHLYQLPSKQLGPMATLAQYALNAWPNVTTKKAPVELIMGHVPWVHQIKRPVTS